MIRALRRLVMRLYPGAFRRTWGAELESVSTQALKTATQTGGEARSAEMLLLIDAIRMLPRAWMDQREHARIVESVVAQDDAPRNSWIKRMLDTLRQDMRHTFAQWRQAPMFTACAIATLAIGMGAAVAIFTVINGVLMRPMPYREPDRIAIIGSQFPFWADLPTLDRANSIESYATWQGWRAAFPEPDGSVGVRLSASVGPEFFQMLGVKPALGRLFDARDAQAAGDPIVLSWATWQSDFAGARDVLGRRIQMDGKTYTIIGVAPQGFEDPLAYPVNDIESAMFRVLVPPPPPARLARPGPGVGIVARLRQNATPGGAATELNNLLRDDYASAQVKPELELIRASDARTGGVKSTLAVLAGAVALLVLIGCVNAANLLLSRATVRRREITVRLALGAVRARIVRQMLTESLMLALAATAIGTWLGYLGSRAIITLGSTAVPRGAHVTLDIRVLLFSLVAAVATSILFGLVPALHTSSVPQAAILREEGRGSSGSRSGRRLRNALVITEIALAVTLSFSAGLLVHSLWKLQHVDPGYDTVNTLTLRVTMSPQKFPYEQRIALHQRIVEQIAAQPGVISAAAVTYHPLSGGGLPVPVGKELENGAKRVNTDFLSITPDYFKAMGIRLISGRSIEYSDAAGSQPVVVLSAQLAKESFNGANAVGNTITLGAVDYRVVGIAADVKEFTVASQNNDGIAYVSYAQTPQELLPPSSSIIVRGRGDAHALGAVSRGAIRDVEARIPIAFVRTMKDMLDIDLLAPRLRTILIGTFGAIAAMLAALGLLGVTAYGVAQTRDEISVRMALGARARQVALQVVRQSLVMACAGVSLGLLLSAAAARALSAFLFGIPASDMLVLASVVVGAVAIAIIAAWYPARRAAHTNPAAVLRSL